MSRVGSTSFKTLAVELVPGQLRVRAESSGGSSHLGFGVKGSVSSFGVRV